MGRPGEGSSPPTAPRGWRKERTPERVSHRMTSREILRPSSRSVAQARPSVSLLERRNSSDEAEEKHRPDGELQDHPHRDSPRSPVTVGPQVSGPQAVALSWNVHHRLPPVFHSASHRHGRNRATERPDYDLGPESFVGNLDGARDP